MSIKVATFKKPRPDEIYACSVPEVQGWAKGLADLRIDFGKQRTFPFDSRALNRPKIEGKIIASVAIDRQLKPSLAFYPMPSAKFSEKAVHDFREQILNELRVWLEEQLALGDSRILGAEVILVEFSENKFKTHKVRYL